MGVGTQAGAELTDVLIVLNSTSVCAQSSCTSLSDRHSTTGCGRSYTLRITKKLKTQQATFTSAGAVTLGTNLSVAVGPLGRNGEASGSISTSGKVSATYSYSKTRGLFGGVSLEGSVIVERQDANAIAYGDSVSAKQLLSGVVEIPPWASSLVRTLETCTSLPGGRKWIHDTAENPGDYLFSGIPSPASEVPITTTPKKRSITSPFGGHKKSSSYFSRVPSSDSLSSRHVHARSSSASPFQNPFESDYKEEDFLASPHLGGGSRLVDIDDSDAYVPQEAYRDRTSNIEGSLLDDFDEYGQKEKPTPVKYKRTLSTPLVPGEVGRVIALYDFRARESGDLSFSKGDVINVLTKSNSTSDWWVLAFLSMSSS